MIDHVRPRKITLLGAGIAVVIAGADEAKVISAVQQTPTPKFTSARCYETDALGLGGVTEDMMLNTGSIAASGSGPINTETGEPFDDAWLYYEARDITPLPVCLLGPQRTTRPAPVTAERIFVTSGDPPTWQELAT